MEDFDTVLTAVAKQLVDKNQIEALGKKLRFTPADISRYLATNVRFQNVTCDGTLKMLRDWNDRTVPAHARQLLREALIAADLARIAATCLPEAPQEPIAPPPPNMSNTQDPALYVTDKQLLFIAANVLADSYCDLTTALECPFVDYDRARHEHQIDLKSALLKLLHDWKMRTGGLKSVLDEALRRAQCGGLVERYKSE